MGQTHLFIWMCRDKNEQKGKEVSKVDPEYLECIQFPNYCNADSTDHLSTVRITLIIECRMCVSLADQIKMNSTFCMWL